MKNKKEAKYNAAQRTFDCSSRTFALLFLCILPLFCLVLVQIFISIQNECIF